MPDRGEVESAVVRVLLVDDHPFVRDGLRVRLESTVHIHVVGEASSVDEALVAMDHVEPDVVITDIRMNGRSGIELAAILRDEWPNARVIVLSMLKEAEYVRQALELGVCGYVLKDAPTQELLLAVEGRNASEPYLSTAIRGVGFVTASSQEARRKALTDRQRAILKLLSEGKTSKAIAQELDMSVRTVETHRLHLRRRLNLEAGAALDRYASDYADLVDLQCK